MVLMAVCSMLGSNVARADGFLSAGLGVADTKFTFGVAAWFVLDGALDNGAWMITPSLEWQAFRLVPVAAGVTDYPAGSTLDLAVGAVYWRGLYTAWHVGLKAHVLFDFDNGNKIRFAMGLPIGYFLIPIAAQLEPMIDTRGAVMFRFVLSWFFMAI